MKLCRMKSSGVAWGRTVEWYEFEKNEMEWKIMEKV